jgi:hypothetical protein
VSGLKVLINKNEMSEMKSRNVLGIVTDINLTLEKHIDKMYNKISSILYIIKRLSNVTELDVLNTVSCGFLSYRITFWGHSASKYTKRN